MTVGGVADGRGDADVADVAEDRCGIATEPGGRIR
jgi:hypothetical protein